MIRSTLALIIVFVLATGSDLKADAVSSPMPSKLVQQRVDQLLREVASADRVRLPALVADLYNIASSKVPGDSLALNYYGYSFSPDMNAGYRFTPMPDRSAVLLRAIPALIGQIDDAQGGGATKRGSYSSIFKVFAQRLNEPFGNVGGKSMGVISSPKLPGASNRPTRRNR